MQLGRGSRLLILILTLAWILGMLVPSSQEVFALVPANVISVHWFLWTIVTAGFYENSFFMGLINICIVVMVAPVMERLWGANILFKFVVFTNVCVYGFFLFWMVAAYIITSKERPFFTAVEGFSAANAAFAVALQQRYPDKTVIRGTPLKTRHIPTLVIILSAVLWAVGRVGGKEAPLVLFGTFFGWAYLRFFLRDPETDVVGDLREEFAFKMLFPNQPHLRAFLKWGSDILFGAFTKMGLFKLALQTNETLPSRQDARHKKPSDLIARPSDPTAERRRAIAMKAIDDKLAELSQSNFAEDDVDLDQETIDSLAREYDEAQ